MWRHHCLWNAKVRSTCDVVFLEERKITLEEKNYVHLLLCPINQRNVGGSLMGAIVLSHQSAKEYWQSSQRLEKRGEAKNISHTFGAILFPREAY